MVKEFLGELGLYFKGLWIWLAISLGLHLIALYYICYK